MSFGLKFGNRHQIVNSGLSVLLIGCVALSILLLRQLALAFRTLSQYCRVYQVQLTPRVFLKGNVATELSVARRRYFERQRQAQTRLREDKRLQALNRLAEGLRAALPNLTDEQLRRRVQECLEHEPQDLEQMRSLWVEIQERAGQKSLAEKLAWGVRQGLLPRRRISGWSGRSFCDPEKVGIQSGEDVCDCHARPVEDTSTGNGGIRNFRSEHCVNIESRVASGKYSKPQVPVQQSKSEKAVRTCTMRGQAEGVVSRPS